MKRLSHDEGVEADGGGDLADLLVRGKVQISRTAVSVFMCVSCVICVLCVGRCDELCV